MPFGFPAFMLPLIGGSPPPEAQDPELNRQIRGERIRMLFAPTVPVAISSALVCVALAVAISDQTGRSWAVGWAVLCVLASIVRLLHLRAYRRSTQRDHPMWLQSLTLMCALHGCCWGLIGLMMPIEDMVTSSVLASTLVGACAVGTFTLQAHLRPNLATNLPTLVPASLMMLSRQDSYGFFGGLGLLSLMALMLFESRRAERRITELLWLRFTTDRIARERTHALVLAQRHSAVKDQFLATMSHEMRTPLHGILGLARLLLDRLPERPGVMHESRHQIELIERAGEHLLHIINDVLDFSRIEAGKLQIQHAAFDLRTLIDEVVELQRVTAQEKGLRLLADVRLPQPCWVLGDASRLRQMLHNLVGNAIKFTELGEIRVRVGHEDQGPGGSIAFHIQDTGVGIPADQLAFIFDAFHQVDGGFARRHKGTGLGLTITREIARAMGGEVACESEVGRGSVFTLRVPLPPTSVPAHAGGQAALPATATEAASDPATAASEARQEGASTPSRFHGHVLLVEDNPVNAMVAEANLARLGLAVTRAEDGAQALTLLQHLDRPFDLVLMDLQMPELDGMEATRRLRSWENDQRLEPIPVVALTANALSTDRAHCLSAGMDDHLPKPFRAEELMAVLQRHLPPTPSGLPT